MNKLKKIFNAIVNLAHKPSLINLIADDRSKWVRYIAKKHPNAKGFPVVGIENFLDNNTIVVSPYAYLDDGSLVTDMALLKSLCLKYKVADYLEFGTWRGESVANIAAIVPNCTTINLNNVDLKEIGFSDEYVKAHQYFSKDLKNVTHILANTLKINADYFKGKKFDLIFIDADHKYESVVNDTKLAFSLLKDGNSVIVWHDYAYNPITVRPNVYAAILDAVSEDKRKYIYHVSNTLCAVYLPENFIVNEKLSHTSKRYFDINIKLNYK